jgi:hypothetical protein
MGGRGTAVICLEAEDPKRPMRELVTSETLFDSWGIGGMGNFFGFEFTLDSVRASRVARSSFPGATAKTSWGSW